jgi:hypothetical protein
MKIANGVLDPNNSDIFGQIAVAPQHPGMKFTLNLNIAMHNLLKGMYARIGSARAYYRDRMIGDFRQGLFKYNLNTAPISLPLPTAKTAAVVFYA